MWSATLKKGNMKGFISKLFETKEAIQAFAKNNGYEIVSIKKN